MHTWRGGHESQLGTAFTFEPLRQLQVLLQRTNAGVHLVCCSGNRSVRSLTLYVSVPSCHAKTSSAVVLVIRVH
jgi:hypothetical protein